MIRAYIDKKEVLIKDTEIICKDESVRKFVKNIYSFILLGFNPSYGDPEKMLVEKLKKIGAKEIEQIDEDENYIY